MKKRGPGGILAGSGNLKLRTRLLLAYFALLVVPLGILSCVSYAKSSLIIRGRMEELAGQALRQSGDFLSLRLRSVENALDALSANADLREILEREADRYPVGQQITDARKLEPLLDNYRINNNVFRIRLFVRDGLLYSNQGIYFHNLRGLRGMPWYRKAEAMGGRICWTFAYEASYLAYSGYEHRRVISAVRIVKSTKGFEETVGAVCIDLPEEEVREIMAKADFNGSSGVLLLDEAGETVSALRDASSGGRDLPFPGRHAAREGTWVTDRALGVEVLTGFRQVAGTPWSLWAWIPTREIVTPAMRLRGEILLMTLAVAAAAWLLAWSIIRSSTARITSLAETMRTVQSGSMPAELPAVGGDEIGDLERDFNCMIRRMDGLLAEKYAAGQRLKSAEVKALQAQINPHFLYNTLDMISWMAKARKAHDVSDAVKLLSRFYRLGLSGGRELISVREELTHVELYLRIQNLRYEGRIVLELDVEEDLLGCGILKLSLQPLVENAVLHGIMEKREKRGTVRIRGRRDGDAALLTIRDDGIGMSREKIAEVLGREVSSGRNGFGVWNIHGRFRMYYGEEYGLSFRSGPGDFTEVTARFPAVRMSEDGNG